MHTLSFRKPVKALGFHSVLPSTGPKRIDRNEVWRAPFSASVLALALSNALLIPGAAVAADWKGLTPNWFTASNWGTGVVPPANIDAIIHGGISPATIAGGNAAAKTVAVGFAAAGGKASLVITGGGKLNSTTGYLGLNPNTSGAATVDGANSVWNNSTTRKQLQLQR